MYESMSAGFVGVVRIGSRYGPWVPQRDGATGRDWSTMFAIAAGPYHE
jgi:hypothetical protein